MFMYKQLKFPSSGSHTANRRHLSLMPVEDVEESLDVPNPDMSAQFHSSNNVHVKMNPKLQKMGAYSGIEVSSDDENDSSVEVSKELEEEKKNESSEQI